MTIQYAVLDQRDVLVGWETHDDPLDPVPDDRVEVPVGCDLALRRYRWDRERLRFDPFSPRTGRLLNGELPHDDRSMRAVALGLDALRQVGAVFPAETNEWLDRMLAPVEAARPTKRRKR